MIFIHSPFSPMESKNLLSSLKLWFLYVVMNYLHEAIMNFDLKSFLPCVFIRICLRHFEWWFSLVSSLNHDFSIVIMLVAHVLSIPILKSMNSKCLMKCQREWFPHYGFEAFTCLCYYFHSVLGVMNTQNLVLYLVFRIFKMVLDKLWSL